MKVTLLVMLVVLTTDLEIKMGCYMGVEKGWCFVMVVVVVVYVCKCPY